MTSFPTSISLTADSWTATSTFQLATGQNATNDSTKHYDAIYNGSNQSGHGIQFRKSGTSTFLDVNGTGDTGVPYYVSIGSSFANNVSVDISDEVGSTVSLWDDLQDRWFYFTITSSMLFVDDEEEEGTSTEGVNLPYVTWGFPHRSCGETTYVSVTHTVAQSVATTYYVHELGVGQIGTIVVGTGAHPSISGSANYSFTISSRTLQVKDSNGSVLGTKVFSCRNKKVFSNFW